MISNSWFSMRNSALLVLPFAAALLALPIGRADRASMAPDAASQQPAAPTPPTPAAYPPVRPATLVYFFMLEGEVKADPIRHALTEMSKGESSCKILYGPIKSDVRPKKSFVAVEASPKVAAKDVVKALKAGVSVADPLAFTCFQGEDGRLGGPNEKVMGYSPRDFVLGMSNDLRWVESSAGFSEFFFERGKMASETIADRYKKLTQPFGRGELGALVHETIAWTLAEPVPALDAAATKRIEKALAKIDGVTSAKIDAVARTLSIALALENLSVSGPALPLVATPPDGKAQGAGDMALDIPRARFDTTPIFDVLDKEKILLAPAASAPAAGGAAKVSKDDERGG